MSPRFKPKLHAFTLVEIMVVVGIICLLAGIAIPNYLRARKRSQATLILEDLRVIDSACDQYAIETSKPGGTAVNWTDIKKYLKLDTQIYNSGGFDILGNAIMGFSVDYPPKLSARSYGALSDITPSDFWSPFYP